MPCCCLNCPSADTNVNTNDSNSNGYLLCHDSACIAPSVDTHDSSGYLLCRVFACIATTDTHDS